MSKSLCLEKLLRILDLLQNFIKEQESRLKQQEVTLHKLSKEKNELEPIVNTHKKTIEAILMVQRKSERRWLQHLISFSYWCCQLGISLFNF